MGKAAYVTQYYFCAMTVERRSVETTSIPVSDTPPTGKNTILSILALPRFLVLSIQVVWAFISYLFLKFFLKFRFPEYANAVRSTRDHSEI